MYVHTYIPSKQAKPNASAIESTTQSTTLLCNNMATATTFRSVQERLSALQETTAQTRKLIARLEAYDPADDGAAAPHGNDEGDYLDDFNGHTDESRGPCFASELTAEILQLLEEQRDELEEIEEEMHDMREGKTEEARHGKATLVEGIRQVREALRR